MPTREQETRRVALCQFGASFDNAANAATSAAMARAAADQGATLICFPETSNTVYPAFEDDPRHLGAAEPVDGSSVSLMRAVARETGTMIVYPFFEREGDHYFNTAVVIGVDGELVGAYRKLSIPSRSSLFTGVSEQSYFEPGNLPLRVFETPWGFSFGIIICYERNLPEPARCLALSGADLILIPVATTERVRPWWDVLLRAHAIFNSVYVGACNKVGVESGGAPDTPYFGTSLAVDPTGQVLAQGSSETEEIVLFDLDLSALRQHRQQWSFFADRRPEMYGALGLDHRPGPAEGDRAGSGAPAVQAGVI